MHWIDWLVFAGIFSIVLYFAFMAKAYSKSVAHFLAAGRCGGRYLIATSEGMGNFGAAAAIAICELYYKSGFCSMWWGNFGAIVAMLISVSGWLVYRYRQTRSLTIAQFFEKRYSKNFRVFMGILAFLTGIFNLSITPAVATKFLMYYIGLPATFQFLGFDVSVYASLMFVVLSIAIFFIFWGGQVAVLLTDAVQGVLVNIAFVILFVFIAMRVDWGYFAERITNRPAGQSLLNPFDTVGIENFDIWFYILTIIGIFYQWMVWQGTQASKSSAKNAHEARMGVLLGNYRVIPQSIFFLLVALLAFTYIDGSRAFPICDNISSQLQNIPNEYDRFQSQTPLFIKNIVPAGLVGLFASVLFMAFISTQDTYMHAWGSIFIQDVIVPLRKKPLTQKQHMKLLKCSIVFVAIFIYVVSLFYRQTQHIILFWMVTGAVYTGGGGAVIIGGLYWKRGTTSGAFCAMVVGAVVALTGVILNQVYAHFFIDGMRFAFLAWSSASIVYVVVSLLDKKAKPCDMDRLLHRGKYAIEGETTLDDTPKRWFNKLLPITSEFTKNDKYVCYGTILLSAWTLLMFIVGTSLELTIGLSEEIWFWYWMATAVLYCGLSVFIVVWFTIGCAKDIRSFFKDLAVSEVCELDDGMVIDGVDAYELEKSDV